MPNGGTGSRAPEAHELSRDPNNTQQAMSPHPVAGTLVGASERRVQEAVDTLRQENARVVNQVERAQGQSRTARFVKRKETPKCVVFEEQPEDGQPEVVGSIYVKKWFAGSAQSIIVTVSKG